LNAAQHGLTERFLFDSGDKVLGDGELDISLKQGEAHFAEGIGNVLFRDPAVTAKFLEGFLKIVGEGGEHGEEGIKKLRGNQIDGVASAARESGAAVVLLLSVPSISGGRGAFSPGAVASDER